MKNVNILKKAPLCIVFVLSLLISNIEVYGQNNGYVSVTAGPSIINQVVSYAPAWNQSQGYIAFPALTKTGYQFNLDLGYFLTANVGIAARFGYSQNPFDTNSIIPATENYTTPSYNSLTITGSHPYKSSFIVAGPLFGFKKGKTYIDFKFMVGAYRAYYPTISIQDNYYNGSSWAIDNEVQTGNMSTQVELMFSGSIRYSLTKNLYIVYNTDLLYTTEAHNTYTTINTTQNGALANTQNITTATFTNINAFSNSIGIGYTIGGGQQAGKK